MPIQIHFKTTRKESNFTAREWNKRLKAAFKELGIYWWREILPKHFLPGAVEEYGYEKRNKGYQIFKGRRKGHQNPLVFTGRLKRELTSGARITSTSNGARIVVRGPDYFHQFAPTGGIILRKRPVGPPVDIFRKDMGKEIRAISDIDERLLAAEMDRLLQLEIGLAGGSGLPIQPEGHRPS